jgi:hypothetical protein
VYGSQNEVPSSTFMFELFFNSVLLHSTSIDGKPDSTASDATYRNSLRLHRRRLSHQTRPFVVKPSKHSEWALLPPSHPTLSDSGFAPLHSSGGRTTMINFGK